MPDQQDTKPKTCCRGLFRFHRSTLVIALLPLLLWLLVALPGRDNGGGKDSTGFSTTRFLHGLPFVFLERQTVEYGKTSANKKSTPRVKPKDVDFDAMAAKAMDTESYQGDYYDFWFGLRFNIPENPKAGGIQNSKIRQDRFWSDLNRWPWLGDADGSAMRIRWLGLLVDVVLILLVLWMLARAVEYRLKKRGRHFAFSLAEMLALFCATGALVAWIGNEYQRAAKENTAFDRLEAAISTNDVGGWRCNSLPALVSELFDHRSILPFTDTHLFRPVEDLWIYLHRDLELNESGEAIVDAFRTADFATVHLEADVDRNNWPTIQAIAEVARVTSLIIFYDFELEMDRVSSTLIDDVNLDFELSLPELKELGINLHYDVDQKKQLGILSPSNHLNRLEIVNLNQQGAAYLNSIAKDFTALKEFDIDFAFNAEWDSKTDAYRDFIDPNFKVKLPEADNTKVTISLDSKIDQRKQLGTFASVKHVDRLEIDFLNQIGIAHLESVGKEFPTAKQLGVHFEFVSDVNHPIPANRYQIDLDFKLPFPGTEEIKITLEQKYDQKKQLQMFEPLNRFKRLSILDVNQQGATYLNSIANELPPNTGVAFPYGTKPIELLPPMRKIDRHFTW